MSQSPLQGREVFNAARSVLLRELQLNGEAGGAGEPDSAAADSQDAQVREEISDEASFGLLAGAAGPAAPSPGEIWLGATPLPAPAPGKADYRSASVNELWGGSCTIPERFPASLDSPVARGRRAEAEQAVQERALELEALWQEARGQVRSEQIRSYARNRAAHPQLGPCSLKREWRSLDRMAALRARVEEKRERAALSGAFDEQGHPGPRLALYDHLLRRIEKIEVGHSHRAEKKLKGDDAWLTFLAEAELALDPGCPHERRLSHLLGIWYGVVTGFLAELERQKDAERADDENNRKEEEAREDRLQATADRVSRDRKRRILRRAPGTPPPAAAPAEEPAPAVNPYAIPGFRLIRG